MLPGFELLFSSVQSQFRSSEDAIVSAIHWTIISAGLKLTAVGENPSDGRPGTEQLLTGWNSGEIYVLHYHSGADPRHTYLLKILPVDGSLLLHFQRDSEENVTTLELPVTEYATDDFSTFASAFKSLDRLNSRLHESLIEPVMGSNSGKAGQGRESQPSSSNGGQEKKKGKKKSSLLVEDHPPSQPPLPMQPPWAGSSGMGGLDPFSVGRSDLDPLAGLGGPGGGGMIMDPRYAGGPRFGTEPRGGFGGPDRGGGIHPGALPPGAVPPGARFDPFGPPGTRPGPDPDHERPPSGYEDMFM